MAVQSGMSDFRRTILRLLKKLLARHWIWFYWIKTIIETSILNSRNLKDQWK